MLFGNKSAKNSHDFTNAHKIPEDTRSNCSCCISLKRDVTSAENLEFQRRTNNFYSFLHVFKASKQISLNLSFIEYTLHVIVTGFVPRL